MSNDTQHQVIESMIQSILAGEPQYFLVDLKIRPINNIKLFLDGDQGITIEKCVQFNRSLYRKIEEAALFTDGDFSLEVSSPGLDEPLKTKRQYSKNIGRLVELVLEDGTKKEGRLVEAGDEGIRIEEVKPKVHGRPRVVPPAIRVQHYFLFHNIKTTKIQIVF